MNIKNNLIHCAWRVMLALVFSLSLLGISAQEVQAGTTYTITSLADTMEGGTLRSAITNSNAIGGADRIEFAVDGTITLGSMLPVINDDLTIDGSGHNITISGADLYRVMVVSAGKTVNLNRLRIVNGRIPTLWGAGIYNEGILTVTDCTFSDNYANGGGAIENYHASLTVVNSTFSGNRSVLAGSGIDNVNGVATVTNSTFSGNTGGEGGGIRNYLGTLTVTNSTFSENNGGDGGGI